MAERLEGVLEELGDMAMDALSRAKRGRPGLEVETGDALAEEQRVAQGPTGSRTLRRGAARGLRRRRPRISRRRRLTRTSSVRLFVAVWPDDDSRRKRLAALQLELGRTKGLRFVGPARWHVTLRFLGEVHTSRHRHRSAEALVTAAAATPGPARVPARARARAGSPACVSSSSPPPGSTAWPPPSVTPRRPSCPSRPSRARPSTAT